MVSPTMTPVTNPAASSTLVEPSSDCSSLKSTYVVPQNPAQAINADVLFEVKCGADFKLPLVMGIRVFTFEDCIKACASHNTNTQDASTGCVAAVYKPDSGQPLTCWLKSIGNANAEVASVSVDAALINRR